MTTTVTTTLFFVKNADGPVPSGRVQLLEKLPRRRTKKEGGNNQTVYTFHVTSALRDSGIISSELEADWDELTGAAPWEVSSQ